jgi:hypothetical protein
LFLQVAVVDRELGILGEEREQNSRKLNLKRVQHVTTLQQLGKISYLMLLLLLIKYGKIVLVFGKHVVK